MKFSTKAVRGPKKKSEIRPRATSVPIYQTAIFPFDDSEDAKAILEREKEGYSYTRLDNPTHKALEERIAFLEGGEVALAFASGMAAISSSLLSLCKTGDRIVSSYPVYEGTIRLYEIFSERFGIETDVLRGEDFLERLEEEMKSNKKKAKIVYLESPSNPTMTLVDLKKASEVAHGAGAKVFVDNTFATPYHQNPIEYGADVVIHSATKYISGHGDTMGGVVVGSKPFVDELKKVIQREFGGIISPFNAWLILRGISTLELRMERHSHNTMEIAKFLESHPKVERVHYPGLPSHPQHELAKEQMRNGFSGVLSFEMKGGYEKAKALVNRVQGITLAVSLGSIDTLIEHPASMTHTRYSKEEIEELGLTEGLVRLAVGIEDVEDLIEDLGKALEE
jgi:methionine-gamma-lyase